MAQQKINSGQLKDGRVSNRQGGSSSNWATNGTSNYATGDVETIVQVGVIRTLSGADIGVTFPVAFSQPPVIAFGAALVNGSSFMRMRSDSVSATGFAVSAVTASGSRAIDDCHWIAVGLA